MKAIEWDGANGRNRQVLTGRIITGPTLPGDLADGDLWIDTSSVPILKAKVGGVVYDIQTTGDDEWPIWVQTYTDELLSLSYDDGFADDVTASYVPTSDTYDTSPTVTINTAPVPFTVAWKDAYWADDPDWSNPGDGNAVSSWRSGGYNNYAVTQANSSLQPTFRSSVVNINSRGAVEFDGAGDVLRSLVYSLDLTGSAVWIGRFTGTPVNPRSDWFCGIGTNAAGTYDWNGTGALVGSVSVTANRTAAARILAQNNSVNNTLVVNGTTSLGGFGSQRFELNGVRIGDSFAVQIAFVGYFVGDVTTDPNWASFVSWVSSYYGLTMG